MGSSTNSGISYASDSDVSDGTATTDSLQTIAFYLSNHPAVIAGVCVAIAIILVLVIIASYYCCCRHDACCCSSSRRRRGSYDIDDVEDQNSQRGSGRGRGGGRDRNRRSMAEMGREMGVDDRRASANRSTGGNGIGSNNTSQESVILEMRGGASSSHTSASAVSNFGHIEDAPPAYEAGPSAPSSSTSASRPLMPIMTEEEENLALSIPYSRREPGSSRLMGSESAEIGHSMPYSAPQGPSRTMSSEEEDLALSIPLSRREPGLSRIATTEDDRGLSLPSSQSEASSSGVIVIAAEDEDLGFSIPFSRREPGSDSTAGNMGVGKR